MVTTIIPPNRTTAWQYQEFLGSAQRPPTPRTGIDAALTWLGENSAPPIGTVIGNIDSNGDVRFFWYGYEWILPVSNE
jgi:hypothetical protein